MEANPTASQTKTIVLSAAGAFEGIRYPNDHLKSEEVLIDDFTPNNLWTKSASKELQKAVEDHVVITDMGSGKARHSLDYQE